MALDAHVAILAHSSLDKLAVNRANPEKAPSFYAQLCFPPEAGADLQAIAARVAPGGSFDGLEVGVKLNSQVGKPVPGVPGNWFVVRASTQYAPYVADGSGAQLEQGNVAHANIIRTHFYAGKKVRAALSAFAWNHTKTGRRGISFNLDGVMAVEDGERLNIGSGVIVNAFAKHADPTKAVGNLPQPTFSQPAAQPEQSPAAAANPFGAQTQTTAAAAPAGNPFAQAAPAAAANANPFAAQA